MLKLFGVDAHWRGCAVVAAESAEEAFELLTAEPYRWLQLRVLDQVVELPLVRGVIFEGMGDN